MAQTAPIVIKVADDPTGERFLVVDIQMEPEFGLERSSEPMDQRQVLAELMARGISRASARVALENARREFHKRT